MNETLVKGRSSFGRSSFDSSMEEPSVAIRSEIRIAEVAFLVEVRAPSSPITRRGRRRVVCVPGVWGEVRSAESTKAT